MFLNGLRRGDDILVELWGVVREVSWLSLRESMFLYGLRHGDGILAEVWMELKKVEEDGRGRGRCIS
jgi:hypothetical protein